jgi:membrane protease YdiL (CAAX protease family)
MSSSWFTDDERRLRTGWRLFIFGALLVLLQAGTAYIAAMTLGPAVFTRDEGGAFDTTLAVTEGLGFVAITVAVYIARRWLDQRSMASLGLAPGKHWHRHILVGTALGVGLQALIFIIEWSAGWLTISSIGWRGPLNGPLGLLALLLVFIVVAWNEELLTRGYLLQNLKEGIGTKAAVVISSLVFGALHLFNENATPIAALGVAFAGLFLAAGYLVTRSLWLPIGLHLGWNYGEGPLFGFPVSGLDAGGLITQQVTGPEAITGGAFGPEAGLISILVEVIGIALLVWWWKRNRAVAEVPVQEVS